MKIAKILKKHKFLVLNLLVLCIFMITAVQFCEEIRVVKETLDTAIQADRAAGNEENAALTAVEAPEDAWFADVPLIVHAGGGIEGHTYTNSREALLNSLEKGACFIEMDLLYTSDGHLVCAHSWDEVYPVKSRPTLETFVASKVQGKFTPLTAEDLVEIMKENPQMHLVIDMKPSTKLFSAVEELALLAEKDTSVLDRLIIQLYEGWEKEPILELYPFADEQFIFTTYKWEKWDMEIARICNENNVYVITAPYGDIPDEDAAMLRDLGFVLYEHTVNRLDQAEYALNRGISGFYTDFLMPEDLAGLKK